MWRLICGGSNPLFFLPIFQQSREGKNTSLLETHSSFSLSLSQISQKNTTHILDNKPLLSPLTIFLLLHWSKLAPPPYSPSAAILHPHQQIPVNASPFKPETISLHKASPTNHSNTTTLNHLNILHCSLTLPPYAKTHFSYFPPHIQHTSPSRTVVQHQTSSSRTPSSLQLINISHPS